jgi:hypothetical protein
MTEPTIREPEELRASCAEKLRPVETSPMFLAILACFLDEDWTEPRILQLVVTHDRCVLARADGDVGFDKFIGAEADLIRNIPKRPTSMETRWVISSAKWPS